MSSFFISFIHEFFFIMITEAGCGPVWPQQVQEMSACRGEFLQSMLQSKVSVLVSSILDPDSCGSALNLSPGSGSALW
jgi:hypothetical protein